MRTSNQTGFTIIETMLFLGITGLLVMGVLVGAGTSINIQRYHDSVLSLQSVLQKQFSEVSNVNNDSAGDLECVGMVKARGQSDCVVLGRFITTEDSRRLSIRSIIGIDNDSVTSVTNDLVALDMYNIQIAPLTTETYEVEWGASLTQASGAQKAFSILILRSPVSGVVRTFINPDSVVSDPEIESLIDQDYLDEGVTMCVDSNGMFTGGQSAIRVNANATNASGVETLGEAMSGC